MSLAHNFALRHFNDTSIKVFEKETILHDFAFINFVDLNEIDVSIMAIFVFENSHFWHDDAVFGTVSFKNPLKILQRYLIIVGNKERLIVTSQTAVEVKNTALLVNKDHVSVEAVTTEHHNNTNQDNRHKDTDCAITLKPIKVVIELEVVTVPILVADVEEQSDWWVKETVDTIPTKYFVPKCGVTVAN